MDKKECPIRLVASYLLISRGLNSRKEGQDAIDLKYCVEDQCKLWEPSSTLHNYVDSDGNLTTKEVAGHCGLKKD